LDPTRPGFGRGLPLVGARTPRAGHGSRRGQSRKGEKRFNRLREQLRDPLLTVLTVVLLIWMFVLAPLHESAARDTNIVGFLLALGVAGALLVLSGKAISVVLMLVGITLAAAGAWIRLHDPSPLDIFLNACAWIIIGLVLIWVLGRAVFAPGRITYHRIMGAILLYLAIGLTFAALYALVGLLSPDAYAAMTVKNSPTLSSTMIYFSFGTLTTAGSGDIAPIHPFAPQPHQYRVDDRAALPGNLAGEAGDPGNRG
jgi:hypothetical protein